MKRRTSISRIRIVVLAAFISLAELNACQLWGLVSDSGIDLINGNPDNELMIHETLDFFQQQGSNFDDGWGLLFYNQSILQTDSNIFRSAVPTSESNDQFDSAQAIIFDQSSNANISVGHLRAGTSGAVGIANPHPFLYESTEQTFSFVHNGTLSKTILLNLLTDNGADSSWLNNNPPNTYGMGDWKDTGWYNVVDSELFFLWLIKNIQESGDIVLGLRTAMEIIHPKIPYASQKNFIFSDGESLYIHGASGNLYYTDGTTVSGSQYSGVDLQHKAVMTYYPYSGPASSLNWISVESGQIVILSPEAVTAVDYSTTAVDPDNAIPSQLTLKQNYPNPFNPGTTIIYTIAYPAIVKVVIYDIRGNNVATLRNEYQDAGRHSLTWNGIDRHGKAAPSGRYFYIVDNGNNRQSKSMTLLR